MGTEYLQRKLISALKMIHSRLETAFPGHSQPFQKLVGASVRLWKLSLGKKYSSSTQLWLYQDVRLHQRATARDFQMAERTVQPPHLLAVKPNYQSHNPTNNNKAKRSLPSFSPTPRRSLPNIPPGPHTL